jgi:HD-like signal output (HDOD) protein
VANSAYYGFSQTISEIKRAVPLIGLDMIRSLALSLGVLDGFAAEKSQTGYDRDQLWLHSLAVGNGVNSLARRMHLKAEHLFITAFLHDIGKLVLDKFFPGDFKHCLTKAAEQGVPTHVVEKGIDRIGSR